MNILCLIAGITVHWERIPAAFRCVAKLALAGLLAVILFISGALSVSHALHQSLHHNGGDNSHFCLVCSLAKGQVSVAAVAVAAGGILSCWLYTIRTVHPVPLLAFDYRISHSRAPPRA